MAQPRFETLVDIYTDSVESFPHRELFGTKKNGRWQWTTYREFGKEVLDIEPDAKVLLERYAYPGNIRELHNIIERAMILCHGKTLTVSCLPRELREATPQMAVAVTQGDQQVVRVEMTLGKQDLAGVESAIIEEVMRVADYNKSLAAKHLGLTRFALDRRLKKLSEEES